MKRGLFIVATFILTNAMGKNLESRFGFGVANTNYQDLTGLSLRYHFDPFLSSAFQVAFNTDDSNNAIRMGAKILRNVSMEENINFYLGAGLFFLADKKTGSTLSGGIELDGILGMEFFLSGLGSLGLSVETGVSLRSVRSVSFSSNGSPFAGAGIHYYF